MGVIIFPKDSASNYEKTALLADLKLAGFDDSIAELIANRVNQMKVKDWTYDMARQEAIKQAYILIENSHTALDNFREGTLSTTGQPTCRERLIAEKMADPGMSP